LLAAGLAAAAALLMGILPISRRAMAMASLQA